MSLYSDLTARGLVEQSSDPEIARLLDAGTAAPVTVYCGYDPTADSLHIGSLVPLLTQARIAKAGHRVIAVVGGATGMIGDPSGKSAERQLLTTDVIAKNVEGLRSQINRVFSLAGVSEPRVVNNADWFRDVSFLEFLRDVGKHFSVNAMIAKDSVRARLEQREQGISFTEFSYMLLQAYDFLHLFEHEGCAFQVGGSDQWGNITAGIDLIRRKRSQPAYGLTFPLVTTSTGQKFGKTEAGAVWLDAHRTSPYQFFQYFLNTDDRDVARYLRFFTFIGSDEVKAIVEESARAPEKRIAQSCLAFEVTSIVHGREEAEKAQRATAALFSGGAGSSSGEAAGVGGAGEAIAAKAEAAAAAGAPSLTVARGELEGEGVFVVNLVSRDDVKLCSSTSDARRQIDQKGIYLNEVVVEDVKRRVTAADLIDGKLLLLRKGKKNYFVVKVSG